MVEKYATFGGRASRSEYWWFTVFQNLVTLAIVSVVAVAMHTGDEMHYVQANIMLEPHWAMYSPLSMMGALVLFVWNIVIIIPATAVTVRRLHDSGRTGWWILVNITGIGTLLILFYMLCRSEDRHNEYGAVPTS